MHDVVPATAHRVRGAAHRGGGQGGEEGHRGEEHGARPVLRHPAGSPLWHPTYNPRRDIDHMGAMHLSKSFTESVEADVWCLPSAFGFLYHKNDKNVITTLLLTTALSKPFCSYCFQIRLEPF